MALLPDDAGLSARVVADVLQHADPAMTQRKYMARGKVHHGAAAILHEAAGCTNPADHDHDGNGSMPSFVRLS
ncbi:hypothetical protein ACFRAQ_06820 [Nocardia sp. NPDC056611]|uniref:hypothetical protein n=1 Tax=Nocardia sp. NPDC056611 TaxID=3345877 RepID=UPI003670AFA9